MSAIQRSGQGRSFHLTLVKRLDRWKVGRPGYITNMLAITNKWLTAATCPGYTEAGHRFFTRYYRVIQVIKIVSCLLEINKFIFTF